MGQKSKVLKQVIKQKGTWNYRDIYNFCFDWLKDNGYGTSENEYTEKISATGKEIQLDWEAKKEVSDYFRNIISVKWHIIGMTDVEAEKEGKKISTNKGELKITITAEMEKDYEKRWEDKPSWKFMRGVYDKYIIRTTIDEYESRLKDETLEFISQIKSFLQLGS